MKISTTCGAPSPTPHRRRILDVLRNKPSTTGDLAEALGETRFLVMQHLNLLREADLVTVEVDGRRRRRGGQCHR